MTQQTTAEGCAFFAFLRRGTYTVTRHRGHRCRRPGGRRAGQTDVGDGRPDRVAAVPVRHSRRRSPSTLVAPGPPPPASTDIPISVANTGLQPYGAVHVPRPGTHDAARRCSRTRAATPCSPATAPTTTRSARTRTATLFYPTPRPSPINVPPGRHRDRRPCRSTPSRCTCRTRPRVAGHRHDARPRPRRRRSACRTPRCARTGPRPVPRRRSVS